MCSRLRRLREGHGCKASGNVREREREREREGEWDHFMLEPRLDTSVSKSVSTTYSKHFTPHICSNKCRLPDLLSNPISIVSWRSLGLLPLRLSPGTPSKRSRVEEHDPWSRDWGMLVTTTEKLGNYKKHHETTYCLKTYILYIYMYYNKSR